MKIDFELEWLALQIRNGSIRKRTWVCDWGKFLSKIFLIKSNWNGLDWD